MDQEMRVITLVHEDTCFEVRLDNETYEEILNDEDKLRRYAKEVYELNFEKENPNRTEEDETTFKQKSFKWSHKSTLALIEFRLQRENEFNRPICKKKKIWDNIAWEMEKLGYKVTGDMCDTKYRNLLATYKVNRKKKEQSGEGAVTWEYFDKFESTLGSKASTAPPPETVGSVDNMEKEDINQEVLDDEALSLSSEASTSSNICMSKKRKTKELCFNDYLKEKLKRDEDTARKKEERWYQKKELKEREITAIEALAQAIASKYKK
ncbi:unnamed protein product [Phaedon cochleariae]|uniref:Myb/SANT-like DNA-binding domain-containing protein n=1 Tax=Phaedon cochleariae TaxID=80249 RepID=A0A9N9SGR7_PHACE|nr:unnamed protein product [Phaedon cochleariae]